MHHYSSKGTLEGILYIIQKTQSCFLGFSVLPANSASDLLFCDLMALYLSNHQSEWSSATHGSNLFFVLQSHPEDAKLKLIIDSLQIFCTLVWPVLLGEMWTGLCNCSKCEKDPDDRVWLWDGYTIF
jgi:hypothetical protein